MGFYDKVACYNILSRLTLARKTTLVCYWPGTVRTLVRFVSAVDLPVPVETAGVGQKLTALLALHCSLPVGPDLPRLYAAQRMFLWLELLLARTDWGARGPPGVAEELAPQSGVEVQAPGEIDRGIRQVNQKISGLSVLQTRQPCTSILSIFYIWYYYILQPYLMNLASPLQGRKGCWWYSVSGHESCRSWGRTPIWSISSRLDSPQFSPQLSHLQKLL